MYSLANEAVRSEVILRDSKKIPLKIIIYIVMIAIALVMGIPFIWMLSTSLKTPGQTFVYPPVWIPTPFQFSNFADAWQKANFSHYFFNSAFITITTVAGQLITSSLAAFSFARLHYKGRDKLFLGYLATMMIPGQVVMIPNFILMRYFGWVNTYQALIIPGIFTAYGTFMLRQFLLSVPPELDEAATIDGCNKLQVYWYIIMPLCKAALATLGVFSFIAAWNSFQWPLIVTNDSNLFTLPLGLSSFNSEHSANYALMMAGTVICVSPILVIYCLAQNYFVEGIALSGIKG